MKNSIAKIALAIAFVIACFSCSKDEVEGTMPQLKAFGPNPALRGSEMTFVGENLDQVKAVVFPENITVEDITKIDKGRIKVIVPENAEPGKIKLLLAGNGELIAQGELTFTEPITITKMDPSPVKAGQTLTIEGDYLNLIEKVIFAEEVEVKCQSFTTWNRKKIELVLPEEAQTGIIILADTAEIPLEFKSEEELRVVLPSVDATLDLTNKKPGEVITVPGYDLDLVKTVQLPDGSNVEFTLTTTGNQALVFTLPANATDGAIVMIPASGVRVAIANIGIAVPAELVADKVTGLRAGDEITISGVNMELVTTVEFTGANEPVIPTLIEPVRIKVVFPADAQSGNLTLNTASGKTASIAIETQKPEVLSFNPNPVSAGTAVELQGHDLDLVKSLTFGGNKKVEDVMATSAASLTVTVPTTAETGEVILTMANGETVTAPSLVIDKPVCAYIPVMPDGEIKGGGLLTVEIENASVLTGVQLNGQTIQYVLTGNTLYIGIPNNAYGNCTLKLVSSNGEIDYTINVIPGGNVENVIWDEGPLSITWSDGGRVMIPITAFDGVTAGTYMKFYFQQTENWGQAQINNGAWAAIPFAELGNDGYLKTDGPMINNDKSITSVEVKLTQDILDNIISNSDGTWGIIIQGSDWIFVKVTLVAKAKISTVIYTGPTDTGGWSGYAQIAADNFTNCKVGDVVHVSTSNVQSDAQGSFKDGATWSEIAPGLEYFSITGDFSLEVTAEILTKLQSSGLIIGGQNYVIEKVSIITEM
jgi:hypothetical protein